MYFFSNWIVVSWTFERFIAVFFPLKLNSWCTLSVLKTFLGFLLIICCLVLVPDVTEIEAIRGIKNGYQCEYSTFYYETYTHFQNTVYMYIPIGSVFVCNSAIIYKVMHSTKQGLGIAQHQDSSLLNKRFQEQKQLTRVLITVACAFLFLHFPQILAKIWQALYPEPSKSLIHSPRKFILFYLFIIIGHNITDYQNSINFFLYCTFGSKVRKIISFYV